MICESTCRPRYYFKKGCIHRSESSDHLLVVSLEQKLLVSLYLAAKPGLEYLMEAYTLRYSLTEIFLYPSSVEGLEPTRDAVQLRGYLQEYLSVDS